MVIETSSWRKEDGTSLPWTPRWFYKEKGEGIKPRILQRISNDVSRIAVIGTKTTHMFPIDSQSQSKSRGFRLQLILHEKLSKII